MTAVYGQDRVKQILDRSIRRNRHAHAYLFHGQAGLGKDTMAVALAMRLLCRQPDPWACGSCSECRRVMALEHPSFTLVHPVPSRPQSMKIGQYDEIIRGRLLSRMQNPYLPVDFHPELTTPPAIGIDQVRDMKKSVMLKTGESEHRVFIVSRAEQMSLAAANSLLKLLEEPPPRTLLVLTSNAPGLILDTIKSRCQNIRFDRIPRDIIAGVLQSERSLDSEKAGFFSRMAGGSLQRAFELAGEDFSVIRDQALAFFRQSLDSDAAAVLDYAAEAGRAKNRQQVITMLQLLRVILRDLLQTGLGFGDKATNSDRSELLTSLLVSYPRLDAETGITLVSEAIDYIGKNVYLPLVLTTLSNRLGQCKETGTVVYGKNT
ncbi:hypothetical protein JXO52_07610 [bacterium]|nr:hypothetical protein [bacterium]